MTKLCTHCGNPVLKGKRGVCDACRPHDKSTNTFTVGLGKKARELHEKGSSKSATRLHMEACRKYRKDFYEKHGYFFDEVTGMSNGGIFDPHHVVYASRAPKHPELHNPRNIILVSRKTHDAFHAGELQDVYERLVRERDLETLFGMKLV